MHAPELRLARRQDLDVLMPLVRAYHELEAIDPGDDVRRGAVEALLGDSGLGRIWLIDSHSATVGYICLCFGYSIEFSGRDAFVDEFFVLESYRGRGIGRAALLSVLSEAESLGITALHLEVSRQNPRAKALYQSMGFEPREKFHLMSRRLGGSRAVSDD